MAQTILTAAGFRRKRYEEFILEAEALARELWGADVNLDARGPLGKFIKSIAFARAEDHELAEAVYNSGNIDTAEGVALDYAVKRGSGITRIQAKKATGTVRFTTTAGKTVTGGVIVATADGLQYMTTATVTAAGTTVDAPVEALQAGPAGNVPPGVITSIKTAIAGVSAVTNPDATAGGRDAETDQQLRDRHYSSLSNFGKGTIDAIRAEILDTVSGVREAFVAENTGDTVDDAGRPPHCIEATVLGGAEADIGAAILRSKAAGIRAFGSQTVIVKDSSGNDQTIGFSFANASAVYVNVNVSKNASFPQNGADLVEYECINYIGGTNAAGQTFPGLGLGDDVIHAKIVSAILSKIPGIDDISVTLRKGDSGPFAAANVVMDSTEVPETDADKVVVVIV